MKATQFPRVKICCIASVDEAFMAIAAGAAALGMVGKMPSGPGPIPDEQIRKIAEKIPPPVAGFLLTSETSAAAIIAHHRKVQTSVIQLVDALQEGSYRQIKDALPSVKLVQVIHVTGENSVEEALAVAPFVDAILLDSGNPAAQVKELGGTGRTHNWQWSKKIREQIDIPLFLAGGLNPQNVREAIETVGPFGIDVCSGVRTNGQLDPEKLSQFFNEISRAGQAGNHL